MTDPVRVMSLTRIATALLGAVFVFYGLRAYRSTRRSNLLLFTLGIGLVTGGFLVEGLLFELGGWTLAQASALESFTTLAAFVVLVLALFARDVRQARATEREP